MTQTESLGADELIQKFRQIKAKLEAMDAKHDEAVKPYKDALTMIKNELKTLLDTAGADSVKTEYGTAYKSVKTNVKTEDKTAFVYLLLDFEAKLGKHVADDVLQDLAELLVRHLDVKANKTYVEDYINAFNEVPAGVQVSRFIDINVRK